MTERNELRPIPISSAEREVIELFRAVPEFRLTIAARDGAVTIRLEGLKEGPYAGLPIERTAPTWEGAWRQIYREGIAAGYARRRA